MWENLPIPSVTHILSAEQWGCAQTGMSLFVEHGLQLIEEGKISLQG